MVTENAHRDGLICEIFLFYIFQFLIFFLTMVFILLTLIFAQEVQGVQTSMPYLISTFAFYLTQDDLFIDLFIKSPWLSKIEQFECREALYGKLTLKIVAIVMAAVANFSMLVSFNCNCMTMTIYYLRVRTFTYFRLSPKSSNTSSSACISTSTLKSKPFFTMKLQPLWKRITP